jgi:isopenicillin-N N-acyltransferase-like protein
VADRGSRPSEGDGGADRHGAAARNASVPYVTVKVRGSHREIGRAVGEAARTQVLSALGWYAEHFRSMANMEFSEAKQRVEGYLDFARKHLPQYVEEMEGMAEGAGVSLEALAVPNCGEEFTCRVVTRRPEDTPMDASPACTAVALVHRGRHIVGHNMDWYAVDLDKNVLFDVTGPSGVRFLAFSGVPYLPALGMNSAGITYVGNALYCNDERTGVPNVLVRRWVLESRTIVEACHRALHPDRARGSDHLFADVAGDIFNLETSAMAGSLTHDRHSFVHTNHFIHADMLRYEGSFRANSRDRLQRARTMLSEGLERDEDPLQLVMEVLRDHAETAICEHPAHEAAPTAGMTVGSMVCDLDNQRMLVCAGPPCRGSYTEHTF